MAYQEFANPTAAQSPEIGEMPRTLQALQYVNTQKERRRMQLADAAKDQKTFVSTSKIPKYANAIGTKASEVTNHRLNEIHSGQLVPSRETQSMKDEVEQMNSEALANEERLKNLENHIVRTKQNDPYYNDTEDWKKHLDVIADTGEPVTRESIQRDALKINDLERSIYHPEEASQNFNKQKFLADYVNKYQPVEHETKVKGANGVESSSLTKSRFFDEKGNEGVTDAVVLDYLGAHPKVAPFYQHEVMQDMQKEIQENKAADPNWMKGKTDGEIMSTIIEHPEANINSKSQGLNFNDRVREKARQDLELHNQLSKKTALDMSEGGESREFGANKNTTVATQYDNGSNAAGVGLVVNHKDKPVPYVNFQPNKYYDLNTGENVKNVNHLDFNANKYLITLRKKNGDLVPFKAQNHDQLLEEIKNMPAHEFTDASWTWAMKGQSINKANESSALDAMNKEMAVNPSDKLQRTIDSFKDWMSGKAGIDPEPLAILKNQFHLNIIQDMMVPIEKESNAEANLNTFTGMNLYGKKVMNRPEFKSVADAIDARVRDSNGSKELVNNYMNSPEGQKFLNKKKEVQKTAENTKTTKTRLELPHVGTQEEYDKLPSGSHYIHPDGTEKIKK